MVNIVPKEQLADYVGKEVGVSDWMVIDQNRINLFADATNDHQFIHIDPAAAAQTPFGGTIAHGYLTLSLLSHLAGKNALLPEGVKMGINYGLNKVRFLTPVKVDNEVRARVVLKDIREKRPGQFMSTLGVTIEIKDEDKPALIAEWLTLVITD